MPTNTEVYLRGLLLWGKSRSLQGLLESKKKIWGDHAFFRDNQETIILKMLKYKEMYGGFFFFFFEALISLKNA